MSVTIPTKVTCKNCGSEAVVKFGSYKGVPRYFCKACNRKFKGDDSLFHMKAAPEHISMALSMYYTGSSIDDIRDFLKQEFDYYPSKNVVFNWVDKYTSIAGKQFRDVHPDVGDEWVADETVLELDKGIKVWFFDIIDSETRFLLASRASLSRTTRDAQMLMDRAIKRAGKYPKVVITDKLASYLDVNYGKDAEHRRGSPFSIKASGESTSQIERFHGTIKERTKVMRAFRDLETLHEFMDGFLVYYNYFRPNDSLNGKTPADAAKVDYKIRNWKDLSQIPVSKQSEIETHKTPKARITITEGSLESTNKRQSQPRIPRFTPKTQKHSSEIDLGGGIVYNRRTGRRHLRLY
ncbi:MAG: DDE-type integrase/transposase/recombinase [Dehalococcoidales bacterium]|nr:DDE-type integrase/transposase/recombinase [Dehalococcoidales bacterium]